MKGHIENGINWCVLDFKSQSYKGVSFGPN